jgi:DNA invertase Pin-like site-specific DNA recombinase
LAKAICFCRTHDATLIIPQLDRLSRNLASLLGLEKQGYVFVNSPNSTVNWHTLGAAALLAEQQRQHRSARIKAALAAAKALGVRVGGNPGNLKRQDVGRARGNAVQATKANARAAVLAPIIAEIRAEGRHGLRKTARVLNERGITAPRGGQWSSQQVKCLLARIGLAGGYPLSAPDA